jgi:hypothetical protein
MLMGRHKTETGTQLGGMSSNLITSL